MTWSLLEGPDGSLVRSIVLSDGSEELTPIEPGIELPDLPAVFGTRDDAELCAELLRRRGGRGLEVAVLPVLEFAAGVSDEHDREPLTLQEAQRGEAFLVVQSVRDQYLDGPP